jgi:hypothetical protein
MNFAVRMLRPQPHQQRLHHDGVADPGRRDDQEFQW